MNFQDGTGGRKMRPEYAGKSTLELIREGKRTATTRDRSQPYNQHKLEVGTRVTFYAAWGKSKGQSVKCVVTKAPYKLSEISAEEWSQLEGWNTDLYYTLLAKGDNYEQFQFKLENDEETIQ